MQVMASVDTVVDGARAPCVMLLAFNLIYP